MAAINLELHKDATGDNKFYDLDGNRVRHIASQDRFAEGLMWEKGIPLKNYKPLPGHPNAGYQKIAAELSPGRKADCIIVKDESELHIFGFVN